MGITGGPKFLYYSEELGFEHVVKILQERAKERGATRPSVDMDASQIGFKFLERACGASTSTFGVAIQCAMAGINVNIMADADTRHHSKRVSSSRKAKALRTSIKSTKAKLELAQLRQRSLDNLEATEDSTKKAELEKQAQANARSLPVEFANQLQLLVDEHNSSQRAIGVVGEITFMKATYQADSKIAERALKRMTDAVIGADTDFAAYIGSLSLSIKDFRYDARSCKISKLVLATPQASLANHVDHLIQQHFPQLESSIRTDNNDGNEGTAQHHAEDSTEAVTNLKHFKLPRLAPIFDSEDSFFVRALIACSLGNDMWESGMPGVGVKTIVDWLAEHKNSIADSTTDTLSRSEFLLGKLEKCKHRGTKVGEIFNREVMRTYVGAMIFEPVGYDCNGGLQYIDEAPESLPQYLSEFGNCPIVEGPAVMTCVGTGGNGKHLFLEAEGFKTCHKCSANICRYCAHVEPGKVDDFAELWCLPCFGGQYTSNGEDVDSMKEALQNKGRCVPCTATYSEIVEWHEEYVERDAFHTFHRESTSVKYPLLPSSLITEGASENPNDSIKVLVETKVQQLPSILHDESLSPENICDLVFLMSELVNVTKNPPLRKKYKVHSVTSEMLIRFAVGSRSFEGLRLLKRSVRHTVDDTNEDIRLASLRIGLFRGELCFWLIQRCKASFKSKSYTTACAFTAEDYVASHCSCNVGGNGDDKHACLHPQSKMYALSLEAFKGLAEVMLIELNVILASPEAGLSEAFEKDKTRMLKSISLLMTAARRDAPKADPHTSIREMLVTYAVGTAKARDAPTPPERHMLKPIRYLKYVNPVTMAKGIIDNDEKSIVKDDVRTDHVDEEPLSIDLSDEYVRSQYLIGVITRTFNRPSMKHLYATERRSPIGFRLLKYRANLAEIRREGFNAATTEETFEAAMDSALQLLERRKNPSSADKNLPSVLVSATKAVETPSAQQQGSANRNRPVLSPVDLNAELSASKSAMSELTRDTSLSPRKWLAKYHEAAEIATGGWKRSVAKKYCSFRGCRGNDLTSKLIKGPKFRGEKPTDFETWSRARQIKFYKRRYVRREWADRLGRGRNDKTKEYYICASHAMEDKAWHRTFELVEAGKTVSINQKIEACVPVPAGVKSFLQRPSSDSKGTSTERLLASYLSTLEDSSTELAYQQALEMIDVENHRQSLEDINPTIRKAARLDVHESAGLFVTPNKKDAVEMQSEADNLANSSLKELPVLTIHDLKPEEVNRRTGFLDICDLLSYVVIICGGVVEAMTKTCTRLTWLEEWMFYCELSYGRTRARWGDIKNDYKLRTKSLRALLKAKLDIVIATRKRWPLFATYGEDLQLRSDYWEQYFPAALKLRIVMHDNTNCIPLMKSADPIIQRATWNDYYGMCCAKGGVFTQLCGWEGTLEAYTGYIGDTDYIDSIKILEYQDKFAERDLVHGEKIPFTNTQDKGYRNQRQAWRAGKQKTLQPVFSRSELRYTSFEVLLTASVATTRSGNERSVNHSKKSWLIKRGASFQPYDLDLLADLWLAWGFQINFMYSPVH